MLLGKLPSVELLPDLNLLFDTRDRLRPCNMKRLSSESTPSGNIFTPEYLNGSTPVNWYAALQREPQLAAAAEADWSGEIICHLLIERKTPTKGRLFAYLLKSHCDPLWQQ
ncbi:hypothetical protein ILYODFUR_027074 [Ilyodon furcidens]|uniref:Uncharacterized protein n=1 Tax=Ilyodon furcidens TaxID=33524 RepID=A0ABV0V8J0_9TELE